jgi:spectinomycin phosphotransferase
MEYLPEGGGAYHWKLSDRSGRVYFVTVDDLDDKDWIGATRPEVLAGLGQALSTATALRDEAALTFVVAPIAPETGGPLDWRTPAARYPDGGPDTVLRRVDDRYAVSVFPFLAGRSFAFGPYGDRQLREEALDLVAALHRATPVVEHRAPAHAPGFGGAADLAAFLAGPDQPWITGPFGEEARGLLAEHTTELARLTAAFGQIVERTTPTRAEPVITHGEPHPANLRSSGGQLYLVDWDTVGLGPPERDLSLIMAGDRDLDDGDLDRYRRATGRSVDPDAITLYWLRWYLDDLASAVKLFRNAHRDTADTRRWRDALAPQLDRLSGWIERADA